MFRIVRSSFHSDFDYAQDDTAGLENIKFVYFSDSRGRLSLQVCGNISVEPAMCAKKYIV